MPQYKVCLAFAELADVALDDFAVAIITGLTDNPRYPTPPVTVPQLATLARDALVLALRKNAAYVEVTCNNDLPTLLSSWFEAASHSAT